MTDTPNMMKISHGNQRIVYNLCVFLTAHPITAETS